MASVTQPVVASGPVVPAPAVTATRSQTYGVVEAMADVIWLRIPLLVRRLSAGLSEPLTDGQHLLAWPLVAVLAPIACLSLGLAAGGQSWGYQIVFTESLQLMMLAVVIGCMSSHLGALFVLGFAIGDFFFAHPPMNFRGSIVNAFVAQRLPLLIEYGLLALLVVSVPMGARAMMAQLQPPRFLGRFVRVPLVLIGHAVLAGLLVYFWQLSAPLLIRPVFTWNHASPTTAAMFPLQRTGMTLAYVAVAAAVARVVIEGAAFLTPGATARIERFQLRLAARAATLRPLMEWVHPWIPVALGALWATFMMSGMIESRVWQWLLGGVLLLLAALRAGLIPVLLGPWPRIAARIPLVIRMAATIGVVYAIAEYVLLRPRPPELVNLRVFVFITIISLVVGFIFSPGLQEARRRRERGPSQGPPTPAPGTAAATQAGPSTAMVTLLTAGGAGLAATLFFPEIAFADNCSSDGDCFGTARAMVAPAAAMGGMALFLSGAGRWFRRGLSLASHLNPVTAPLAWGYGFVTGRDFWTNEKTYFDLEWAKEVPEAFWEDYASGQALDRLATMLVNVPEGFKQGYEGLKNQLEVAGKFWADTFKDPEKLADTMAALPDAAKGAAGDMMRLARELEAASTAQDTTRFGELMGQMTGNAMFQALLAKGQTAALQGVSRGVQTLRGGQAAAAAGRTPVPTPPRPVTTPRSAPAAGGAGGARPNLSQGGVHPALNATPTPPRPTIVPPRQPSPPTVSRPPAAPSTASTPRSVAPAAPARPTIQPPARPPQPPTPPRAAPPPAPPPAPKPPTYRGTRELVGELKRPQPSVQGAQLVNTGPSKAPLVQLAPENCGIVTAESIKASKGLPVSPSQAGTRANAIGNGNFKPGQGMTSTDLARHLSSEPGGLRAVPVKNANVADVRVSLDQGNSVAAMVRTPGGGNHWVHVQKVSSQNVTFLDPWNGRTWTAPIDSFNKSMLGDLVFVR